jgi:acyl-CoA ligase (AMP-forming) (exosortase A-associated)
LFTISDLLTWQQKKAAPEKVAIVDGAQRVTYAELLERSQRYATVLREVGLRRGDRVGIFLRRSVGALTALFATWLAGGVAVVINELLRARQVQYILKHSEASVLVTDSRQLLSLADFPRDSVSVINIDQVEPSGDSCPPEPVIGEDLALIIYTSGSTGLPKGVMVSHDNLLSGARIVSNYLKLSERDVILSILPLSFDYGLNQALTALLVGGTLVLQRSLFQADICTILQKENITGMAGVPTLWLQLTGKYSPFLKMDFPHLRYITNSGGQLPEHTVRLIRKIHPHVQIYLMYGLTEAFRSTYLPPDQVDVRPASIGKAIPNVEVMVINNEGRLCQADEVGELVHRGANVAMGYWRDPEGSAQVFRPYPFQDYGNGYRERVVFSGDLVKMDAEGYLYFVGRKDQLIKSRGFRVSPEEIERCIDSSTLVSHVVAFAVRGDEGDDDIAVAVIPSEASHFREEAVQEFCKEEMPEYMRPRVIWRLDEFPLTSSGKPDRRRIQEMYVEWRERAGIAVRAARTA